MVTKRGPRGDLLCHWPLGEMRRYSSGRRLLQWLRAGDVAGDSDKVTARSNIGSRGGGRRGGGAKRRAPDVLRLLQALPTPYDAAGKAQSLGKFGDARKEQGWRRRDAACYPSLLESIPQKFAAPSQFSSQPSSRRVVPLIYKPAPLQGKISSSTAAEKFSKT